MTQRSVPGPRAFLLGRPGRYPFNGHLRLVVAGSGGAVLHLAASVAPAAEPPVAWRAARVLWRAFRELQGGTVQELLRSAWSVLAGVDRALLGPARGEDLCLLLFALEPGGVSGVAGTGLAALYELGDSPRPLVPPGHPLLELRGIPADYPNYLRPAEPPARLVGAAATGALPLVSGDWARACGWREPIHER